MRFLVPALVLLTAAPTVFAREAAKPARPEWRSALAAFRDGDYDKAQSMLPAVADTLAKNRDYYLYLLGESRFYAGDYAGARSAFAELAKLRDSRLWPQADFRVADCLWMEGRYEESAAAYTKLVGKPGDKKPSVDQAVGRFRIAQALAQAAADRPSAPGAIEAAARAFMQVHVDFPAHPLGVEAGRRATALAPVASEPTPAEPAPAERLQRATALSKARHWQEALDELARLPAQLPPEVAIERDFATGMAKYQARRDYAGAAALLLAVAPKLPDDRGAFAAFHGARSLSRIDRDDEAIAEYRKVVAVYPRSTWAPEAQFRAGWLDFNRGRFRESLNDLEETVARYPKSSFGDDAVWYLALARYFLGDTKEALDHLARYEGYASKPTDDRTMRVRYWRSRIWTKLGKQQEAKASLRDCVTRSPYSYYALLCRARLAELGEKPPWPKLPDITRQPEGLAHPVVERVRELERADLVREAGIELERNESVLLKRGGKKAQAFLLSAYKRLGSFYRAYKLAEAQEGTVETTRLVLEAAYPRAYADAVETYGKRSGSPELFVYAIMRKESTYHPFAVSPSDARGLLQLLPSTSESVAKRLGRTAYSDELFEPETNIELGAAYLGSLLRRFRGQEALAAGAYNAGARAMMRWCDQWGERPFDEFIELITYDQAREYIKRVLGIYARYRHLYGKPLELSLTFHAKYTKDDAEL